MTIEDLEAVYELSKACFSVPWSMDSLTKELSNPVAQYQVAEIGHEIVGYAGLWCVMDEGEITNIAVAHEHRQKGIGQAILQALLTRAKENNLKKVHLEVRASNTAAIKLYEKVGFNVMGTRKHYYTQPVEDAVIMSYEL